MAPSLLAVGTAALACVGSAAAKQWYLQDSYDASNFFDKFDFVTEGESGFAHYQNKKDAFDLGLAQYNGDEVYLGVDHKTVLEQGEGFAGRPSVRIESKAQYNHGLFIARFSHLPESKCGTWPGFFTFGAPWPTAGGINIYSGSHESSINQPSLHTGNSKDLGVCRLDGEGQTAPVSTENCDNTFSNAPLQSEGQGCAASEHDGPFATPEGGVYAVEWTNKFIKLYSWKWNNVPANINSEEPNTDSWGAPSVWLKNQNCEIDDHFVNQRLALSINLCGSGAWTDSCQASTGAASCVDYVSSKPADFANSFFKVKDIRYFKGVRALTKTTSFVQEQETEAPVADLRRGIVDPHTTSSFATGGSTTSTHGPFTNSSTISTSQTSTSSSATTTLTDSQTGSSTTTGTQTGSSSSSTGTQTGSSSSSTGTETGSSSSSTGTQTGSSSSSTGTQTGSSSSSGTQTGSISSTKTGTDPATGTSTSNTGSQTGSSSSATGSQTGSSSTGTQTGSISSTKTGTDPATGTSTSNTGSQTGSVSTSKTGSESQTGSTSKTGSETGPITTTKTTGPITTSSVELTTSTVYTTVTETVTKCPPGHPCTGVVITKTIPWYTTVCPVTATPTDGPETITETLTKVYTITACPPEVKDCPYGKVITKYITTTYCPGGEKPTAPVDTPAEHTGKPHGGDKPHGDEKPSGGNKPHGSDKPHGPAEVTQTVTKGFQPPAAFTPEAGKTKTVYQTVGGSAKPSGFETVPASASAPNTAVPTKGTECTGENCKPEVVTAGAAKVGASVAVVFGAIIAMML